MGEITLPHAPVATKEKLLVTIVPFVLRRPKFCAALGTVPDTKE